jgi:hypothetical protein
MPPSDSLPPSATAPVPLASGLPRCGRLCCASEADDTCARPRVVRRRRVTGSPQNREWVEERRGPPRLLDRPLPTCHGRTPRRIRPSPRPLRAEGVVAFMQHPGHPGRVEVSGPHAPLPTRAHAYASPRPFLALAQGWLPARAGSPLAGRDAHPLDDRRSFMKVSSLHSPSTSIAWSH